VETFGSTKAIAGMASLHTATGKNSSKMLKEMEEVWTSGDQH
jgi:hypothetical protein